MNKNDSFSAADIADRHRRYMAFGLLAISLVFLSKAAMYLVQSRIGFYLDTFQLLMALTTLALFSPIMIWKLRHRSAGERFVYFSEDGYAAQALIYAQKRSWAITFLVLAFLETLTQLLSKYPSRFVVQIVLSIMLGSMSLIFLYKTWKDDQLEVEEGDAHA